MSKSIILSPIQWDLLKTKLTNDYSPSVMYIRSKMKDKLGFTPREHVEWIPTGKKGKTVPKNEVHLDFYSEPKRTMFVLKYSEYLEKDPTIKFKVW